MAYVTSRLRRLSRAFLHFTAFICMNFIGHFSNPIDPESIACGGWEHDGGSKVTKPRCHGKISYLNVSGVVKVYSNESLGLMKFFDLKAAVYT